MAKAKETHGPFDAYTEVETSVGVFGVPKGFTLTVGDDGTVTRDAAAIVPSTPPPSPVTEPEPPSPVTEPEATSESVTEEGSEEESAKPAGMWGRITNSQ